MEQTEAPWNIEERNAILSALEEKGNVSVHEVVQAADSIEPAAIGTALEMLEEGIPIGIDCCEGHWVSFTYSDGIGFYLAKEPSDLDPMLEMIEDHEKYLKALKAGLKRAQDRLRAEQN
jgi:hypothetical protein